ncbi:MAG: competence/damage-inducible protein A [Fimbriimonas sp.]|nr:competence/damage-inducible protein A [Fimbriimonas sp.]
MTAEIVSVGTELLLGQIVDTHAPLMARILAECGIGCTHRATVGDNMDRLVATLKQALGRADVVVTIGGLGPTVDDLTRDGIAIALDDTLEEVPEVAHKLRAFFESRGVQMTHSNLKQALKPTCAELIDNPNGTAPGLICQKGGKAVLALPGPKGEFDPMAQGPVRQFLEQLQGGQVIHSRVLRIIGLGESLVEERVRDLMDGENPTVAPYAQTAECHLRVTARAADREAAELMIDPVVDEIRNRIGNHLYGFNETTIEMATLDLLVERGETVSVAESMTGGALGARITSVPGSSKAFRGGVIVYTVDAKQTLLGIDSGLLTEFGPVSEETAKAMAETVRERLGSTYGVAITGNAGPTADVDGKPVGLAYIAVAGPDGVTVDKAQYRGLREDIQRRATQTALSQLRWKLLSDA